MTKLENKYQEALEVVNQSDDEKFIKDSRAYYEKYKIHPVAILQKLVDKEKPMLVTNIHVDEFYCPNCHSEITHDISNYGSRPKYCEDCGQKLDWGEYE